MKLGMVWHRNWIEEEINESYNNHPDVPEGYIGRRVFCKRRHAITEPMESDCTDCPYFAGLMQGWGHECAWEDILDDGITEGDTRDIPWPAREKEMFRVSKLIGSGILQKG